MHTGATCYRNRAGGASEGRAPPGEGPSAAAEWLRRVEGAARAGAFRPIRARSVVEPGPETLARAGERCRVHEHADGRIEVFHGDDRLPCRVFFDKEPRGKDADIVANKHLAAVLTRIRTDQQKRDRQRLASPELTLRQKERIRAASS